MGKLNISLNYSGEHLKRLDRWDEQSLHTLGDRVRGEIEEGETVLLAISNILNDRTQGTLEFPASSARPGYDDRQGEVEQALRRGADRDEA